MRTTVDLPDDIHAMAHELAHQQKKTMSEVLTEFIRLGITSQSAAHAVPSGLISGLPTVRLGRPITSEDVRLLEEMPS
ncbi:antitoxin [Candidatus Poriferisocius sp.]|uniref:antitoxin n=1 Tax=Candidatus Poriferisocius sp. TaxID=3101276 RepID=UPI003B013874